MPAFAGMSGACVNVVESGSSAMQGSARRGGMRLSRAVFMVHSWLGLSFCLLLSVILLSGTLSVFRDEIDWLIYPQVRVSPALQRAGLDQVLATVRSAHPDMGLLGHLPAQGAGPRTALNIIGVSPQDGVRRIWVDPYRGVVQGTTPFMTVGYFIGQFHSFLLVPTWGYVIVTSFSFFMLASLVTGLLTYRKFWRGFFRVPRRRNLRTLMGDLHRLGGVWSIAFLAIMIVTGTFYFWIRVGEPLLGFPKLIHEHTHPSIAEEALDRMGPTAPGTQSLDRLAQVVRAEFPGFEIRHVELPRLHGAPVTFGGNTGEFFGPNLSEVFVDPYGGKILGADLSRDGFSSSFVRVLADALHFGDFAGLVSKAFWFLFGLVTTGLAISGVIVFWKRSARSTGHERYARGRRLWNVLKPWGGAMGFLKPVNLAVVVLAVAASVMTLRFYAASTHERAASYAAQDVGPWKLGALMIAGLGDTSDPVRAGGRAMVLVRFCSDCWGSIKRLWVNVGRDPLSAKGLRVSGQPGFAYVNVRLPQALGADLRLWMSAEGWDGTLHHASWPLGGRK
jgi:uncharacterized iron-regulated membrane protein